MKPQKQPAQISRSGVWSFIFSGLTGAWLGLALIKFGNPVILDKLIPWPIDFGEFIFQPWPVVCGYYFLAGLVLLGLPICNFGIKAPRWIVAMPAVWWIWQLIAATQTIDLFLTKVTLFHFTACVVCFYLGLFALSQIRSLSYFWTGLLIGFAFVLWFGFDQHYGGLEATRRSFYSEHPDWRTYPPEFLKKIASNRIFSTLVYPNALAGAILLLLPPLLVNFWRLTSRVSRVARGVLIGLLGYGGLACLYWSGSKSGWLIALFLVLFVLAHLPLARRVVVSFVVAILVLGLIGFYFRFSEYLARGATSVSARFDYWKAAWQTALRNPFFGTGPGTFSISYGKVKPPQAEMAQLVHNDYLEQASDSGVIGFVAYFGVTFGFLAYLYRNSKADQRRFSIWIGLFAWMLQCLVEFGLYIPALAWPAFILLGWLSGDQTEEK